MIPRKEYERRRRQLMKITGEGAIVIICAAPEKVRNSDVFYPYRQDSDFLYLTGFREPEAVLVLIPEAKGGRSIERAVSVALTLSLCHRNNPGAARIPPAAPGIPGVGPRRASSK